MTCEVKTPSGFSGVYIYSFTEEWRYLGEMDCNTTAGYVQEPYVDARLAMPFGGRQLAGIPSSTSRDGVGIRSS